MKIIDKINATLAKGEKVFSFEFFPPKTKNGVKNLYIRINRLGSFEPTWVDITWGAGGRTGDLTLEIAKNAQKYCSVDVLMHLTCTNMTKDKLREVLQQAKDAGIENILALRGDPVRGQGGVWKQCEDGLRNAKELVEFIRKEFGDHFCIAVSGYPEGYAGMAKYDDDLNFLKEKVAAGADVVLTQLFYRGDAYGKYLKDCKAAGITAPIIPGIMPIQNFRAFKAMTEYCKCQIPDELLNQLKKHKDDDEAVREVGIDIVTKLCNECLDHGAPGLHFYTLNLERSVRQIIRRVGLAGYNNEEPEDNKRPGKKDKNNNDDDDEKNKNNNEESKEGDTKNDVAKVLANSPTISATYGNDVNYGPSLSLGDDALKGSDKASQIKVGPRAASRRRFPWRASTLSNRSDENVRPIFWANRPKSYMARTESWDEFPNGRWGDKNSPAFGELGETHFFHFNSGTMVERKAQWNEAPLQASDINEVFAKYVEGKVSRLPWCTEPLQLETLEIIERLGKLNRNGFLTINSQPAVNAVSSDDPVFGWGGPNGRIYQKAYIEFFCSPKKLGQFMESISEIPNCSLTYHAIDINGNSYSNSNTKAPSAVTWGIFPGREALQPTVVDPEIFEVWKDEAFSLWLSEWANLYNEESRSSELIHEIHNTYYLVNVVDHDFINGNIFDIFETISARYSETSSDSASVDIGR
jgi:methylenetetrahydrofolate reductase (NADPH)